MNRDLPQFIILSCCLSESSMNSDLPQSIIALHSGGNLIASSTALILLGQSKLPCFHQQLYPSLAFFWRWHITLCHRFKVLFTECLNQLNIFWRSIVEQTNQIVLQHRDICINCICCISQICLVVLTFLPNDPLAARGTSLAADFWYFLISWIATLPG